MKNEIVSSEESFNSKYTFWQLLKEYRIEIPIIQRDYAQGRDSAEAIRQELLESIFSALINKICLNFDYIYGSSEEYQEGTGKSSVTFHKLTPLDGQQRLTTFFLLHWYLAEKENRMNEAREALHRFSYTNRISSREFCEMLVDTNYSPKIDESVSAYIKNENRYFSVWDKDPTIKAMLTMLDAIHEKFFFCEPLFDRLISDSPALLTFNFRPMEHYALTDDLYIKMNARGKPLSQFENFKAKFIQHLKKFGLPYENFENNIDGRWVYLLWDYRSDDNTIDNQFMNLFCYCTEMIYLINEETHNCESPFRSSDVRTLVSYYDSEEKVTLLYRLMDLWESREEANNYLEGILSSKRESGKVRLFEGNPDILSDIIEGNSVTIVNKILLFSIMYRLIRLGKETEKDKMVDYVRISRNLLIGVRSFIKEKCTFASDFRFGRQGIPFASFICRYLTMEEDPYHFISGEYREEYEINEVVYRQESEKAAAIIEKPESKALIQALEDLTIFQSSIFNILDYAVEYQNPSLANELESLFTPALSAYIIPALLSFGDYGINIGTTFLGKKSFYGNKNHWYEILTYLRNQNKDILNSFVRQYMDHKPDERKNILTEIAQENLKSIDFSDWRYTLIKYPSTLGDTLDIVNPNLIFTFEVNENITIVHRMNGFRLKAFHIVPELIEAANQLKDFNARLHSGQNSEIGSLEINKIPHSPINIYLDSKNLLNIYGNKTLCEEVKEKFSLVNLDDLDRVEKIICFAKIVVEVFTNAKE